MKLRRLVKQLTAAAVAGCMALSLSMPALAATWDISNLGQYTDFESTFDSIRVEGTAEGRNVILYGYDGNTWDASSSYAETDETVLTGGKGYYNRVTLDGTAAPVSAVLQNLRIEQEETAVSSACVYINGSVSLDLRDTSTLISPVYSAIYSQFWDQADLTIGGTGTLNLRSRYGISLPEESSFTMNGGTVDFAEVKGHSLEYGVYAKTITLAGGRLHAVITPSYVSETDPDYFSDYREVLYAAGDLFIQGGTLEAEPATGSSAYSNTDSFRVLYSETGNITISGGEVKAPAGEIVSKEGSILISGGEVSVNTLRSPGSLTISGGTVTAKDFDAPERIALSGNAKVTLDDRISEEALDRFDLSRLTTDGYLRYKSMRTDLETDEEGYVVIRGMLEPPVPADPDTDTDTGSAPAGSIGGAIAAAAIGGAAIWGGYEVATRVILHQLLPAGAAIPKTQAELAVLLWTTAGSPEPLNAPAFADVDETTAKAAQWCTEQGYLTDTFQPDKHVAKYNVIRAWKKAFPKAK